VETGFGWLAISAFIFGVYWIIVNRLAIKKNSEKE
jgi:hypothetical protein